MKPFGFHEDAPIEEIVAVMDDTQLLALAASLTKTLAKAAIREFGSLDAAVAAPVSRLLAVGLNVAAANRVKAIEAAVHRVLRGEIKARDTLCSEAAVLGYLRGTMAFEGVEQFPHPVPRQAQSPDCRRGPPNRHGRSYAGLSA